MGCFGGPGSSDPIRFTCANASVSLMVIQAYDLRADQIRPPASDDVTQFNVEAQVPSGATAEQVKAMLRNLLSERFKLAFHHASAEVKGYALIVAKSGLKMKESAPDPPSTNAKSDGPRAAPGPVKDADGFLYLPVSGGLTVSRANGLTRWVGRNVPVDAGAGDVRLTGLLHSLTDQPVIDSTGLRGKYDFVLTFSSDSAVGEREPARVPASPSDDGGIPLPVAAGPTVFQALEEQLGLKMESRRVVIDIFVIDHREKAPVEN
jgi:uncharacterized protein (TIGR03435 family)